MGRIFCNFLLIFCFILTFSGSLFVDCLISNETSCNAYLKVLWTSEFSHAPFVSSPIFTDTNGDGQLDVIGATFTETIKAVNILSGNVVPNLNWPNHLHDTSTYSSPIEYDIDNDGMLDVLIFTSDGEILPYQLDGTLISQKVFKLPPVYIKKDWHERAVRVSHEKIDEYVKMEVKPDQLWQEYIRADPHILATPVIMDLNSDKLPDELIVPVSYYIDREAFISSEDSGQESTGLKFDELSNYLLGSLLVYNITDYSILKDMHLDLTKVTSEYPGYLLTTPTVVDLDGVGGPLEVVLGTSAGNLMVFDRNWKNRPGFPIAYDVLHSQISVADLDQNGDLELIVIDNSGNVFCVKSNGQTLWDAQISGTSSPGAVFGDIDGDDVLDVVISTNDGKIWALQGNTGEVMSSWPITVGGRLMASPTLTKFGKNIKGLLVLVLADNGHIHMISGSGECREVFHVGESSFIPILLQPSPTRGADAHILIGTKDGSLMSVGIYNTSIERRMGQQFGGRVAQGTHDFTVAISPSTKQLVDISSSWFSVAFTIQDTTVLHVAKKKYSVRIYVGSHLLTTSEYDRPGDFTVDVKAINQPLQGHVVVHVTNSHGVTAIDKYIARFNFNFQSDLQWLLITPFIVNLIVLLFVYGFPLGDYLPVLNRQQNKIR
ncbi:uncharacterized protein LOC135484491 [Lineus longissimus]|uniref:uncharacterized protein LOC135484491 n=1 Tax=Lineus longissimus TaxID=88925 RepID=UPI00315CF1A5